MARKSDEAIAYEDLITFLGSALSKKQREPVCAGVIRFHGDVQTRLTKSVDEGNLNEALKLVRTLNVANFVLSRFGCMIGTSETRGE
jgi:hypothetical protein